MLKLIRKKKLVVVILVIAALVPLFTYAQFQSSKTLQEKVGTSDWHTQVQQKIIDMQNRLTSSSLPDEWRQYIEINIQQEQYYLNHNINPTAPGAPSFVRNFIEQAIALLLPLMIMVIASDIVSSELSAGTVKLLLTRPVKRWKILLSKYIALTLSVSFIILIASFIAYIISGLVFGYGGWNMPLISGFTIHNNELITTHAHLIPQWKYILMDVGLAWFVCFIVATLTFMLSVIIRSTAAVMGVMLSLLISGAILANMVSSWKSAKYLFMVNLDLTNYISGVAPPIKGMTLGFSMTVLTIWGGVALIIAFLSFVKRDIY